MAQAQALQRLRAVAGDGARDGGAPNGNVLSRRGRSMPLTAAEEAAAEDGARPPAKRARRGGRGGSRKQPVARRAAAKAAAARSASVAREEEHPADTVKIGRRHQAVVPPWAGTPGGLPRPTFEMEPKLAFSAVERDGRPLVGAQAVDEFLGVVNREVTRRDGYPLSPMDEERALVAYTRCKGRAPAALRRALRDIPRRQELPGAALRGLRRRSARFT